MKLVLRVCCLSFFLSFMAPSVHANIVFGSKEAGFLVSAGTLNLSSASLSNGTIQSVGGTLAASSAMSCTGVTIVHETGSTHKTMSVDGSVVLSGSPAITISDNQKLLVNGGLVSPLVTASGGTSIPSIIQGFGQFANNILVSGGKQLNMRWTNALNVDISCGSASVVKLEQDLYFAAGKYITAIDNSYLVHVDFNGYRLYIGGDETNPTTVRDPQSWSNANIFLSGPVTLANVSTVTQAAAGGYFNGNGNTLYFNSSAVLDNNGFAVNFVDITLSGVTSSTLTGAGVWTLLNTTIESGESSLTVNGSITSPTIDLFNGATTFGLSRIVINKPFSFAGNWSLGDECLINGCGNVLSFNGGCFTVGALCHFVDITLSDVVGSSFSTEAAQLLMLSGVNWMADDGSLRINGLPGENTGAQVTLDTESATGNIFSSATSWSDAVIELLSDVTLHTTWYITGNTIIDGGGHRLNLADGCLSVADGCVLTLRNIILDDVFTSSLADVATGYVDLANVTIILGGSDVSWGGHATCVTVNGPLTVVTGSHSLTMPYAVGTTTLNGITAYYDTLSTSDNNNLIGCSGSGRVLFVSAPVVGEVIIMSGTSHANSNLSLVPGEIGYALNFISDATYDGSSHLLTFSQDSSAVITLADAITVTTKNITFERMVPSHISFGAGSEMLFAHNTIIRLTGDWAGDTALTRVLQFGEESISNQSMTLDLNGYMIDMADASARIALQGGSGTSLRICNGRLLNLSATKLSALAGTVIILENVELGLLSDTTYAAAALRCEGSCSITGTAGASFLYTSTDNLLIASASRLTIFDRLTYSHENEGISNFVLEDSTSCLELIGAVFKRMNTITDNPLTIVRGVIVADHKSTINVGSKGIVFGDGSNEPTIIMRPGATIAVDASASGVFAFQPND